MTPTQTGDKPMVTPELLPCPFCDGEADFGTRPYKNSLWSIHCSGCTAYRVGQTRAEAIAAWNTRAQETLSPEQPRGDPELGEAARNYAAALDPFDSAALSPSPDVGLAEENERLREALSQSYVDQARATLSNIGGSNDGYDLVQRLRTHFDEAPPRHSETSFTRPLLIEAAARIEELEFYLSEAADHLAMVLHADPGVKERAVRSAARDWWLAFNAKQEATLTEGNSKKHRDTIDGQNLGI